MAAAAGGGGGGPAAATCMAERVDDIHPIYKFMNPYSDVNNKNIIMSFLFEKFKFGALLFNRNDKSNYKNKDVENLFRALNIRRKNFNQAPGAVAAAGANNSPIPVQNFCVIYTRPNDAPPYKYDENADKPELVMTRWICAFDLHNIQNWRFNTKTFTNSILELWSLKKNIKRVAHLGDELEEKLRQIKVAKLLHYFLKEQLMLYFPGATVWLIANNARIAENYRTNGFFEVGPPYKQNLTVYSPVGTESGGAGWSFICPLNPSEIYYKVTTDESSLENYFKTAANTTLKVLIHGWKNRSLLKGCENFMLPHNITLYIWNERGVELEYAIGVELLRRINNSPTSIQPRERQLLAIPMFNILEPLSKIDKDNYINSVVPNIQQYYFGKVYARTFEGGSSVPNHLFANLQGNFREQGFYAIDGYTDMSLQIVHNKIKDFFDLSSIKHRTFFTLREVIEYIHKYNTTNKPITIHIISCTDEEEIPPEIKARHDADFTANRIGYEIAAIENAKRVYPGDVESVANAMYTCSEELTRFTDFYNQTLNFPTKLQLMQYLAVWQQQYRIMQMRLAGDNGAAAAGGGGGVEAAGGGGGGGAAAAGGGGGDHNNNSNDNHSMGVKRPPHFTWRNPGGGYRRTRRKLKQRRRTNKRSKTLKK